MTRGTYNPWLHRFAALAAFATLVLICVGGLVTSKGVGLAVPDWPTTFGYNMFFFPIQKWVGGVAYEHSHRLVASGVGLLTTILAVWLWIKEERRWLRWLGTVAFLTVVGQGVLGGLRVTALKDELGIFHATLAQMFFVLVCAIALFTSKWWRASTRLKPALQTKMHVFVTGLIFAQLIIGATMRHQHAGLAIPDFPLAYGRIWPAMGAESVARYNQLRLEATALHPITSSGVALQMTHRLMAFAIVFAVAFVSWKTLRRFGAAALAGKLAIAWMALIAIQVVLGAATIWTNKSADIATAHVAVGALSLVTGAMLVLTVPRCFPDSPGFPAGALPEPQPAGASI